MSINTSFDKGMDPFAKPYQECSKCGGRLGLRVESTSTGGSKTYQICRKCGQQILTSQINVIRQAQYDER